MVVVVMMMVVVNTLPINAPCDNDDDDDGNYEHIAFSACDACRIILGNNDSSTACPTPNQRRTRKTQSLA